MSFWGRFRKSDKALAQEGPGSGPLETVPTKGTTTSQEPEPHDIITIAKSLPTAAIDVGTWAESFAPGTVRRDFEGNPVTSSTHIQVPSGYELVKADSHSFGRFEMPETEDQSETPRGLYWDPFSLVEQLGFREKPSAITYATLDAMVWKVPIIQAIIQTRINQVSAFCSPQHHKFETGFRVKMRALEDRPTAADKKFMRAMESMLLQSGTVGSDPRQRDNLDSFLRKSVRDSLTFDQMNWELIPDRRGKPSEWHAIDAKTIRLANTSKLYPQDDMNAIHTVQIYDNIVISEWTRNEMAFEVRNPRSDIRSYGYGTSELEMLVTTVTAILWALQYNQNMFAQGSLQKGLLNLVGAIPERQLRAFRRQWYQMVAGVENSHRTPITNAEKVEWINMQNSNKDMEFSAYMDFLIKVACAVYAIDPAEVNFKYGNSGANRSMFEGANKSKIIESKDRGLKPLLRFLGRAIDKHIIWPINPNFTFEFVGLESQTPKEMADLYTQRVRTIYTIDELRAEQDMEPLADGLGNVILDANWMNARKENEAKKDQEEAAKKAEAEQEAQAAALASMPGSQVSKEEIGTLTSLLSTPAQSAAPGVAPGAPGPGNSGGPGGGRVAPAAPPVGSSAVKPSTRAPISKSLDSDESVVLTFEV